MSYYDTTEGKRVLDLENQITTLSANIYAANDILRDIHLE